jgi:hypothetical protein
MKKAAIAAGVIAALVIAYLLWPRGEAKRPAPPEKGAPQAGLSAGVTGVVQPKRVPGQRYNAQGQPVNAQGRPIGPPVGWDPQNVQPLAPGELPTSPPILDDPAQREQYKQYWVGEMKRRAAIWLKEHPDLPAPADADVDRVMDKLYDASEQWPLDETNEQTQVRSQELSDALEEFFDLYGDTPKSVSTFGEDPMYGPVPPPPFDVPGTPAAVELQPNVPRGPPPSR